jgi:2-C-methyl-D-erythritol 4-phosphate cytidylyltransferase
LERFEAEDDAHVVETFSDLKIKIVDGSFDNIKITTLDDIR